MSSSTWTPDALSSRAEVFAFRCWRIVEAQHQASTMKLTDSLDEQDILEQIIEATKPAIPAGCEGLDFLLMTPFRYSVRNPIGSRFRRPHAPLGVFYASEHAATAVAEMAFYRLLFYAESPATPYPDNPGEYTGFAVEIAGDRALNLTAPPFADDGRLYHLSDYSHSQGFADQARDSRHRFAAISLGTRSRARIELRRAVACSLCQARPGQSSELETACRRQRRPCRVRSLRACRSHSIAPPSAPIRD